MNKTLADMTPEERADRVGMWAEHQHENYLSLDVILHADAELVITFDPELKNQHYVTTPELIEKITPRPDLTRAWNPDGTPVETTEEVNYRIVNPDTNNGKYQLRRHTRHVTEWTPQ